MGEMKALVAVEDTGSAVTVPELWLSDQDRDLADRLVQKLRDRYLRPSRPVIIDVASKHSALLEALDGQRVHSHTMEKVIDESSKRPLPPDFFPEKMGREEATALIKASEERHAKWARDISTSIGDQEEHAEAEARKGFNEMLARGAGTIRHYFFNINDGKGEKVADLWLQLAEDRLSYGCHHIEVDPNKRRMGFGKKVVAFWEGLAFRQGVKVMRVKIQGDNEMAQRLFLSTGFTTVIKSFVMPAE